MVVDVTIVDLEVDSEMEAWNECGVESRVSQTDGDREGGGESNLIVDAR